MYIIYITPEAGHRRLPEHAQEQPEAGRRRHPQQAQEEHQAVERWLAHLKQPAFVLYV
jgi:hypothetical protein